MPTSVAVSQLAVIGFLAKKGRRCFTSAQLSGLPLVFAVGRGHPAYAHSPYCTRRGQTNPFVLRHTFRHFTHHILQITTPPLMLCSASVRSVMPRLCACFWLTSSCRAHPSVKWPEHPVRFLISNSGQQTPVNFFGVFSNRGFNCGSTVSTARKNVRYRRNQNHRHAPGISLQCVPGTVFIHFVEEVEQGGGKGIIPSNGLNQVTGCSSVISSATAVPGERAETG